MIQQTVDRLKAVIPPEQIWVLTNDHLRAEIVKQLPEVPKAQIIAEPAQRNTAPAIALAAEIIQSKDNQAVMGVFPSDHVIGKPREYTKLLRPAFASAGEGKIVVLGIAPRWAETGYGYIEFPKNATTTSGAVPITRFREKPDAKTAAKFMAAGNFYWNAGMFFFRTAILIDAMRTFQPKTAELLAGLPKFGSRGFNTKLQQTFPQCDNISIDYAVLERAKNVLALRRVILAGMMWAVGTRFMNCTSAIRAATIFAA